MDSVKKRQRKIAAISLLFLYGYILYLNGRNVTRRHRFQTNLQMNPTFRCSAHPKKNAIMCDALLFVHRVCDTMMVVLRWRQHIIKLLLNFNGFSFCIHYGFYDQSIKLIVFRLDFFMFFTSKINFHIYQGETIFYPCLFETQLIVSFLLWTLDSNITRTLYLNFQFG